MAGFRGRAARGLVRATEPARCGRGGARAIMGCGRPRYADGGSRARQAVGDHGCGGRGWRESRSRLFVPDQWKVLRDLRLAALHDAPHAFLGSAEAEQGRMPVDWRRECVSHRWLLASVWTTSTPESPRSSYRTTSTRTWSPSGCTALPPPWCGHGADPCGRDAGPRGRPRRAQPVGHRRQRGGPCHLRLARLPAGGSDQAPRPPRRREEEEFSKKLAVTGDR